MNADVIYHAAGGTGNGVVESADMLDSFVGGAQTSLGIAENGVDYSDDAGNLRKKLIRIVEKYRQKIIDGEIVVPENYEELENYLEDL